ncbi:MAG TPA: hypothetical protein VK626_01720 [Nitrospiraceae bacterium]|nr:hypothetical protein [Nitrospiraceae bacterium]
MDSRWNHYLKVTWSMGKRHPGTALFLLVTFIRGEIKQKIFPRRSYRDMVRYFRGCSLKTRRTLLMGRTWRQFSLAHKARH